MNDEENTWKSGQTLDWSNAEDIKLGPLEPNCVTFSNIVKIYTDCRVEIAEGAMLDDASRAFWNGIKEIAPFILKNAIEEEREVCAKVAEELHSPSTAAAIRARGKT